MKVKVKYYRATFYLHKEVRSQIVLADTAREARKLIRDNFSLPPHHLLELISETKTVDIDGRYIIQAINAYDDEDKEEKNND